MGDSNVDLEARVSSQSQSVREMENKLAEITSELDTAGRSLQESEQREKELENIIQQSKMSEAMMQENIERLNTDIADSHAENGRLVEALDSASTRLQQASHQDQEIKHLQKLVLDFQERLTTTNVRKIELDEKCQELENNNTRLQKEKEILQKKLSSTREDILKDSNSHRDDLNKVEKEVAQLKLEIDSKTAELEGQEAKRKAAELQAHRLQDSLQIIKEERDRLRSEASYFPSEHNGLHSPVSARGSPSPQSARSSPETPVNKRIQIRSLEAELVESKTREETVEEELSHLQTKLNKASSQCARLELENETLKRDLGYTKEQLAQAQLSISNRDMSALEQQEQDHQTLSLLRQKFQAEKLGLETRADLAERRLNAAETERDDLLTQLSTMREELKELQATSVELKTTQDEKNNLESRLEHVQKELASGSNNINAMSAKLQQCEKERDVLQDEIRTAQSQITDMETDLKMAEEKLHIAAENSKEYATKTTETAEEMALLYAKAERAETLKREMTTQMDRMLDENSHLKTQLNWQRSQENTLREELRTMHEQSRTALKERNGFLDMWTDGMRQMNEKQASARSKIMKELVREVDDKRLETAKLEQQRDTAEHTATYYREALAKQGLR
eukprot:m.80375 g.80375  ORF g.80375 m.80375 type:complete len:627 (+) comp12754_c0_seq2:2504-4384(+)